MFGDDEAVRRSLGATALLVNLGLAVPTRENERLVPAVLYLPSLREV